jgi:hypothetical protein
LLNLSVKKEKKLQDSQVYSRLYWETKLKQPVLDEWTAHRKTALETAGTQLPEYPPIAFCNEVVKRLLKTESPEVKDEVERYRQGSANAGDIAELDEEEKKRAERAKKYHE